MLSNVKLWLNDLALVANKNKLSATKGKKYIWYSNNKNKDIKRKFSKEGEKLPTAGRLSSRSSGDSTGGEWLYDFTLREFDKSNRLIGIPLVAEIELSDSKIKGLLYDFNKLLQSDAEHKVFIFQQKTELEYEDILLHIEAAIKSYGHKSASKYLLAGWITSKYYFIYREYSV